MNREIKNLNNIDCPFPFCSYGICDSHTSLFCRHVHGKRVLVVTNTTIASIYLDKVVGALTYMDPNVSVESVILPDGEK